MFLLIAILADWKAKGYEKSEILVITYGPTNYCAGLPMTARSRNLLPGDKIKTSRVTEQVFLYFKHIFMYVLL